MHPVHGKLAACSCGSGALTGPLPQLCNHSVHMPARAQELQRSVAERLRAQLRVTACSVHEALQEAGDAVLAATNVAQVLPLSSGSLPASALQAAAWPAGPGKARQGLSPTIAAIRPGKQHCAGLPHRPLHGAARLPTSKLGRARAQ